MSNFEQEEEKIGVIIAAHDNIFKEVNKVPVICYNICDMIRLGCNHIYISYDSTLYNETMFLDPSLRLLMGLDEDLFINKENNFKIELYPTSGNEHAYSFDRFLNEKFIGKDVLFYTPRPNSIIIGDFRLFLNKEGKSPKSVMDEYNISIIKKFGFNLFLNLKINKYMIDIIKSKSLNSIFEIMNNITNICEYTEYMCVDISFIYGFGEFAIDNGDASKHIEDLEKEHFCVLGDIAFYAYRDSIISIETLKNYFSKWKRTNYFSVNKSLVMSSFILDNLELD